MRTHHANRSDSGSMAGRPVDWKHLRGTWECQAKNVPSGVRVSEGVGGLGEYRGLVPATNQEL